MKCISVSGLFQAYKGNCIYLFAISMQGGPVQLQAGLNGGLDISEW